MIKIILLVLLFNFCFSKEIILDNNIDNYSLCLQQVYNFINLREIEDESCLKGLNREQFNGKNPLCTINLFELSLNSKKTKKFTGLDTISKVIEFGFLNNKTSSIVIKCEPLKSTKFTLTDESCLYDIELFNRGRKTKQNFSYCLKNYQFENFIENSGEQFCKITAWKNDYTEIELSKVKSKFNLKQPIIISIGCSVDNFFEVEEYKIENNHYKIYMAEKTSSNVETQVNMQLCKKDINNFFIMGFK